MQNNMVQVTSRIHRLICYLWYSLPVTYLLYAYLAFGIGMTGVMKIVLSPGYWFFSIVAVLAANGILNIRWYGWYTFIFSNFLLSYQTAVILVYYGNSQEKTILFFSTLFVQIVIGMMVGKQIRVPYLFPKIRWWESDPRYKLSVPVRVCKASANPTSNTDALMDLEGEILDLSQKGCFIKTHAYFRPNELVDLEFTVFDHSIKCLGRVLWRTESTVTHPKGIGVRFEQIRKDSSTALKKATKHLRRLARTYNQKSRERSWQEYVSREKRFQGKSSPDDKK